MARFVDAVLSVWRIRRMARGGQGISFVLVLEIILGIVALIFPIVGQIAITIDILSQHLNLIEKAAWIFFVWVMPIVGPLLYLFIGPRRAQAPMAPPTSRA